MYGIEHQLELGPKVEGNAYELTSDQAERLPWSLEEAVNATDSSAIVRELLGEEFVDLFLHTRRWELECERSAVTDWERARYLELI
jgi:glutamine synthetase